MLYEDDFEFEEQPSDVRDRTIGGRSGGKGGGRGPGTRRGRDPRRSGGQAHVAGAVPEDAKPAHDLLREILERMGVSPIEIGYVSRPEGEYLEISGPHFGMLIGRHGNTLEALNLIFNNSLNAGLRANRRYYTIDAEGYRAAPRRSAQRSRACDARALPAGRQAATARTDASVGAQNRSSLARVVRERPHRVGGRGTRAVRRRASSLSTGAHTGHSDTIAAIATPPGRGAIAVVRVSGPDDAASHRAPRARESAAAAPVRRARNDC